MTRILIGLVAGSLLGTLYFGGLWLTVRGLERARRPALRVGASYLARLGLVAAGFGLLAVRGGFPVVASALAAFLAARHLLVRRLGEVDGRDGRPRLPRSPSSEPTAGTAGEA